jgi:hypothetical protein
MYCTATELLRLTFQQLLRPKNVILSIEKLSNFVILCQGILCFHNVITTYA